MAWKGVGGAAAIFLLLSPQVAAAQTAAAEEAPSAQKLALARQLVDASGIRTTMSNSMRSMVSGLTSSQAGDLSPERQEKAKILAQAEEDALTKMVPQIVQSMENSYARTYSEQELTDILAFYRSPSGRAMVAKTPQFTQAMVADMVRLVPQMRRDMGEEFCAKTTCTPSEKAAFFGAQQAPGQ